jgi:4a-hydroxytetrahydrobiopterin dehydratase
MHLYEQHCLSKTSPQLLTKEEIKKLLIEIPLWKSSAENKAIIRNFKFKDYHQTLLFINAIAEIIHKQNHHPDIKFGYNNCTVSFSTHSANGITLFDFICAARIEHLLLNQEFNA